MVDLHDVYEQQPFHTKALAISKGVNDFRVMITLMQGWSQLTVGYLAPGSHGDHRGDGSRFALFTYRSLDWA